MASDSSDWTNSLGSTGTFADQWRPRRRHARHQLRGLRRLGVAGLRGRLRLVGRDRQCRLLPHLGARTGTTCQTRIDWLTTFRLRAGYTWSHFLFYATAGGAVGDFRLSTIPRRHHNPTPPLGWAAGAGVEYLFNDAISAKLEYLYVNLGTVSCPAGTLCSVDNIALPDWLGFLHRKPDPRRHQLQVQLVIVDGSSGA